MTTITDLDTDCVMAKNEEELLPCPLCGLKMHEFEDGNFGHDMEYKSGIESTCPLRGQLFHESERLAWKMRPSQNEKLALLIDDDKIFRVIDNLDNIAIKNGEKCCDSRTISRELKSTVKQWAKIGVVK